jgi:hypothetical protein
MSLELTTINTKPGCNAPANFKAMQTITDIGQARDISETSARVAVRRAYEKLDLKMPKELSNTDPLPGFILELIQTKGAKVAKLNGNAAKAAEATPAQEAVQPALPETIQSDLKPAVEPEVIPAVVVEKKERRVRKAVEFEPEPIKTDLLETVLNKKITVLVALGVCIAVDGYCAGLVSEREINTPGAFWVFGVLGIVFGFAAIYNAYRLSRKERGKWEVNYTGWWIFAFMVFQYLLHGSAFQIFSDWSRLTAEQIISRNLLCLITPLATSALSVTLFAHKK